MDRHSQNKEDLDRIVSYINEMMDSFEDISQKLVQRLDKCQEFGCIPSCIRIHEYYATYHGLGQSRYRGHEFGSIRSDFQILNREVRGEGPSYGQPTNYVGSASNAAAIVRLCETCLGSDHATGDCPHMQTHAREETYGTTASDSANYERGRRGPGLTNVGHFEPFKHLT